MKLADKVFKLRKQFGLSQEELAEKMNVSRQSVSKWESAGSIPDLNKILLLAKIFGVSTDYLLKDDIEHSEGMTEVAEEKVAIVTLEMANQYVECKVKASRLISSGLLCVLCSPIPFLLLLAAQNSDVIHLSNNVTTAIGLLMLFLMVSVGVSFFIKSNVYSSINTTIETEDFELAYGVESIFKERMEAMKNEYHKRISISIFAFISSFVPLILVSLLFTHRSLEYLMVAVLFGMIGGGISNLILVSTRFNAYSLITSEGHFAPSKKESYSLLIKVGGIYLSLVTAIYLGWSFYTMNWGVTWIIWPVSAVLFAAVIGSIKLMQDKD